MPKEDTSEAPLGATPQLRVSLYGTHKVYCADLSSYLDNRGPVDRLRVQGRSVYLRTHDSQFGFADEYRIAATSFGAPAPWDRIMVDLGTGSRTGWIHGHYPPARPFITNGHLLLWVPKAAQRAIARLPVNVELGRDAFLAHQENLQGEAWDDGHDLADLRAEHSAGGNFVRVGPAAVSTRLMFALRLLGAKRVRACRARGPVDVIDFGVVMPLSLAEEAGS